MKPDSNPGIVFIYLIANHGAGSKLLHAARAYGIAGGTVLIGRELLGDHLLDMFGLNDVKRDILLLASERDMGLGFIASLEDNRRLFKHEPGLALVQNIDFVCGSQSLPCAGFKHVESGEDAMHHLVFTVVEKGRGEDVAEAAEKAGVSSVFLIKARGCGVHEQSRIFNMDIEPEKEVVLFLSQADKTEQCVSAIRDEIDIAKPGQGVIFVQNVSQVYRLGS